MAWRLSSERQASTEELCGSDWLPGMSAVAGGGSVGGDSGRLS